MHSNTLKQLHAQHMLRSSHTILYNFYSIALTHVTMSTACTPSVLQQCVCGYWEGGLRVLELAQQRTALRSTTSVSFPNETRV